MHFHLPTDFLLVYNPKSAINLIISSQHNLTSLSVISFYFSNNNNLKISQTVEYSIEGLELISISHGLYSSSIKKS